MEYITHNLIMIMPFFIILMPFVLIHRILEMKKRQYLKIKTTKYRELGVIALMYSFILIGTLTLGTSINFFWLPYIAEHIDESLKSINFITFKGMIEFTIHGFVNIFGNIFMFIPFGFCAALLSQREKKVKHIVLQGVGISLGIEITQVLIIRAADINDIILNIVGTFLGVYLLNLLEKHFPSFFRKFIPDKLINELTLKDKRKSNVITILQIVLWIVLCVNLKYMVMNFYQFRF
ncbi:MAG: glycopeptide antibiotics resistance protein [Clostridium sp.]|jgi:glycopeptide antibiotics resistance protein